MDRHHSSNYSRVHALCSNKHSLTGVCLRYCWCSQLRFSWEQGWWIFGTQVSSSELHFSILWPVFAAYANVLRHFREWHWYGMCPELSFFREAPISIFGESVDWHCILTCSIATATLLNAAFAWHFVLWQWPYESAAVWGLQFCPQKFHGEGHAVTSFL